MNEIREAFRRARASYFWTQVRGWSQYALPASFVIMLAVLLTASLIDGLLQPPPIQTVTSLIGPKVVMVSIVTALLVFYYRQLIDDLRLNVRAVDYHWANIVLLFLIPFLIIVSLALDLYMVYTTIPTISVPAPPAPKGVNALSVGSFVPALLLLLFLITRTGFRSFGEMRSRVLVGQAQEAPGGAAVARSTLRSVLIVYGVYIIATGVLLLLPSWGQRGLRLRNTRLRCNISQWQCVHCPRICCTHRCVGCRQISTPVLDFHIAAITYCH